MAGRYTQEEVNELVAKAVAAEAYNGREVIENYEESLQSLKQTVEELLTKNQTLETQMAAKDQNIANEVGALEQSEKKYAALEKDYDSVKGELNKFDDKLTKLGSEIKRGYEEQLAQQGAKIANLEGELAAIYDDVMDKPGTVRVRSIRLANLELSDLHAPVADDNQEVLALTLHAPFSKPIGRMIAQGLHGVELTD
jgi:chromosome segregation ATPase